MKRLSFVLFLLVIFAGAACADPLSEPILLTSCGQSADVLMVKTLLNRDSLSFEYVADATGESVAGKASVILVLGGSSKGLGQAKISADVEMARVKSVLDSARAMKIPVLAIHLGGLARRGALSDPFNRLGAESAAHILVVKGGDDDQFFTKIAAEKKCAVEVLKLALDVGSRLRELYRPPAP